MDRLEPEMELKHIQSAKRDHSHFRVLYRAYIERIYAYVGSRVNDLHDAEDIVSQIFIRAMENLNQYKEDYPFSSWLFGIAHNAVVDHYRREERQSALVSINEISNQDNQAETPENILSRHQEAIEIQSFIRKLSTRRQEVITLHFYGGLRNKEIAQVLQLDERTVASHLSRALDDLQALMKGDNNNEINTRTGS